MLFVPTVPQQPLSPRAQELGQRVALTIAEFQQKYPDLTGEEIRQALEVASDRSPDGSRPARVAMVAVAAGIAVVAGMGVFLVGNRVALPHLGAWPAIVAAGVAIVAAIVARRRRE